MDKISIVVAVYNAEKTLKKCVDSLIGQTLKNTEIILVNDCSKDNSSSICKQYESEYSNVIAIDNPYNVGVSATRNNGIEKAKGDYICFVDSDDYIAPIMVEKLVEKKYLYPAGCEHNYDLLVKNTWLILSGWYGFSMIFKNTKYTITKEEFFVSIWNMYVYHLTESGKEIVRKSYADLIEN